MRDDEEYLFEDNPSEYIQRDMEVSKKGVPNMSFPPSSILLLLPPPSSFFFSQGSDQDTRRRCSCDLIRALCQQFDEVVTSICIEYIGNMVNLYQVG